MPVGETIKVWDVLVRSAHWLLVVTFVISYLTQENNYDLHLDAGYAVLGLVVIRIFWGVTGTRHARFGNFVYSPAVVLGYVRDLMRRRTRRYLGHNPLGGINVVFMLVILLLIAVSGIALDAAENRAGPLGDTTLFYYGGTIHTLHVYTTNLGLALIALHLIGVLYASRVHRENLARSMITGRKRR